MLVAQKTLCGKDNIFHKIFCAHFVTSAFVSSVGRAWDCSEKVCFDIPRSPVQSRHGGFHLFDFLVKCLSFTTHSLCTYLTLSRRVLHCFINHLSFVWTWARSNKTRVNDRFLCNFSKNLFGQSRKITMCSIMYNC